MDSEKDEMNQTDIAALHHFYSKHIRDLPDDQALTELFAQVKLGTLQHWVVLPVYSFAATIEKVVYVVFILNYVLKTSCRTLETAAAISLCVY